MSRRSGTDSDRGKLAAALAEEARATSVGTTTGEHPEIDDLLDYHAGTLDPDAEERLRRHLVGCRRCARRLLELEPLATPDPGEEDAVADFAMNASLRRLEARIKEEKSGSGTGPAAGRRPSAGSPPVVLRFVAAVLAAAVVGLSAWVAHLHGTAAGLRRIVEALDRPRPNLAVAYLEPLAHRGAPPEPAELAQGQPFWVLVLIPEDPRPRPEYEVTLLGPEGAELWRERGLEMGDGGGISLSLPRRLLPAGEYRLRLHVLDGGERTLAGEYLVHSPPDPDS